MSERIIPDLVYSTKTRMIPGSIHSSKTKNKILDEATKLFAIKGFGAVSMRDIGKEVGIKMATIYYYYDNKNALFEDVMARFESGYRHYFDWLQEENAKAETLEQLMDNMFNKELLEILDPIGRMGISLALKEQHNILSARKCVFDLLYNHSAKCLKADFDGLIEKGVIPPGDTEAIAKLLANNILIYNDIRLHEYFGYKSSIDCEKELCSLKSFLTCALTQGLNR